jgi:exopolysaccharide biosynthesis polyprenyl glycosylphosphotransferase
MRNVLIVGSTEYAAALSSRFTEQPQLGMRATGHVAMQVSDSFFSQEAWLETIDKSIGEGSVQVLVIEDTETADADLLSKLSWHLLRHDLEVLVAPSFIHQFGPRLDFVAHAELPLLYLDEPALNAVQKVAKRLFDIFFSLFAIIVLSPILIATAIGILITNFGPILFIQKRVGLNGKPFKILKFRSMVVNAQDLQESVWQSASDDGSNNKAKNDPRVTSIGRLLRKFSIDELPQLFNVLKGDMSIVGPRPIQEVELNSLGNLDLRRHLIKPGLTGLWQISGRSDTTWEERIQLDLEYLQNWSLALDVGIVLKTVPVVVSGDGAY